ncbi:hypothetical protein [Streptomyces sp. NRRL S-813]|uniref:hypothetical protein n=1 Tax=Streptomyces sp. NRRL S-813 TaxID=1463919 RepID=UPI000B0797AB|nr:hypothetical protein [Streptomyces sp. NRRL S-813]
MLLERTGSSTAISAYITATVVISLVDIRFMPGAQDAVEPQGDRLPMKVSDLPRA